MTSGRSWILPTLATLALGLSPAAAEAQSGFGVVGGVNFATFGGDDAEDIDHKTGLVLGAFASIPLGQVLTFRPEVLYTQKGAEAEDEGGVFTASLDYLEIPVLLRIGVPGVGAGLHALVGPTLSFELDCSIEFEGESSEDCDTAEDLEADARKSFLVGGMIGAGVDLPFGPTLLSLDGRYTFDLENFIEEPGPDLNNRVWSITASVGFPLGN